MIKSQKNMLRSTLKLMEIEDPNAHKKTNLNFNKKEINLKTCHEKKTQLIS